MFAGAFAPNEETALSMLAQQSIQVMVVRHELAHPTGFDLLTSAREQNPATKVILVGHEVSTNDLLEAGRRLSPFEFPPQPF